MGKLFFVFLLFSVQLAHSQDSITAPLLVWSSSNQPDQISASSGPVIFYSPHQDDETLGMGAAIAENVRIGNPVYVVLFANGGGSAVLDVLNGKSPCPYHQTTHHFNLSRQAFINARNAEFIAACKILGVHRIYIANNGSGWDESISLENLTNQFKELILFFHDQFPSASHNLISGNCDVPPSESRQKAHSAGAIAIHQLYMSGLLTNVQLFRDYVYYYAPEKRMADKIRPVLYSDMLVRQCACDEYGYFNPEEGRYAIGATHSVPQLFNDSYWSVFEYVDSTQNDCPEEK